MGSDFDSFDQSELGDFVQSELGDRNNPVSGARMVITYIYPVRPWYPAIPQYEAMYDVSIARIREDVVQRNLPSTSKMPWTVLRWVPPADPNSYFCPSRTPPSDVFNFLNWTVVPYTGNEVPPRATWHAAFNMNRSGFDSSLKWTVLCEGVSNDGVFLDGSEFAAFRDAIAADGHRAIGVATGPNIGLGDWIGWAHSLMVPFFGRTDG